MHSCTRKYLANFYTNLARYMRVCVFFCKLACKVYRMYLFLCQLLFDLTNPIGCNLISVFFLTNALRHIFISLHDLINLHGHNSIYISSWFYQSRLISVLVLTNHLKCHTILLILLCLTTTFLTALGCFCLAHHLYFVVSLLEYECT